MHLCYMRSYTKKMLPQKHLCNYAETVLNPAQVILGLEIAPNRWCKSYEFERGAKMCNGPDKTYKIHSKE